MTSIRNLKGAFSLIDILNDNDIMDSIINDAIEKDINIADYDDLSMDYDELLIESCL
ncbi:MAG: hypothetical protein RR406_00065 [Bacilli bacterium]